jgi:large subunit ribosomal protein L5
MAEEKQKKEKKPQDSKAQGQSKKAKKPKEQAAEVVDEPQQPAPPPRLLVRYRQEIVPALQQKLGVKNALAVPRLEKIVVSMGLGKIMTSGTADAKSKMEEAEKELAVITGQKPVRCKAKKSVANFKVRQGMETGLKVTLRGARMYEFVDRLVTLAIPRVKDFRGLDPKGFDKDGNYNFGFTEQTVFPEVNAAEVGFQQGMNITMVTTAVSAEHGRELLRQFGMPFRDASAEQAQAPSK